MEKDGMELVLIKINKQNMKLKMVKGKEKYIIIMVYYYLKENI